MDYLYDQTQYFSIIEENQASLSSLGNPEGKHCSLLKASDYNSNSELYAKIAQAIQFGPTEAHRVLLLDTQKTSVLQLNAHISKTTELLICFGLAPEQLGLAMQIVKNKVYKTETYNFIFTDSLEEMKTNTDKKKLFWNCIQSYLNK